MLTLKQRQERTARRAARIAAKHEAIRAAACTTEERTCAMTQETKTRKGRSRVTPGPATARAKTGAKAKGDEALKAAAKVASKVLGVPVGVVGGQVGAGGKPAADAAQVAAKKVKAAKPKGERKGGALDAAVQVLKTAGGGPLGCKEMVERMLAKGLWQTKGKTPHSTLYAAIIREIAAKGKDARFHKTGRGQFELRAAARR